MLALIMKMFALLPERPLFVNPCGSWHASQLYTNWSALPSCVVPARKLAFVFPWLFTLLLLAVALPVFVWHAAHSPDTVERPVTAFTLSLRRFPE
jgi:hypothetical protein